MKSNFSMDMVNGGIMCLACHHKCVIEPETLGICGVRANLNGVLISLVDSASVSVAVDPIEKKPLYHFLPGTKTYSVGAFGCNFGCSFCQNHYLSQSIRGREAVHSDNYMSPAQIVTEAIRNSCPSISFTYSEPTVWVEYALDTIKLAREQGLKSIFVSNGYQSNELLDVLIPVLDAINIDLKAFSYEFYKKYAGASMEPVLQNIRRIYGRGVHVEITTLVIPGLNDSPDELKELVDFIAIISKNIPWHISRFFPQYKMTDLEPTPIETLEMAYEIGVDAGLKFVYVGNVNESKLSSTYCPECNEIAVFRSAYNCELLYNSEGKCCNCDGDLHIIGF